MAGMTRFVTTHVYHHQINIKANGVYKTTKHTFRRSCSTHLHSSLISQCDDESACLLFRLDLLTFYNPRSPVDLQPPCKRTPTCFVPLLLVPDLYRSLKINSLFDIRIERSSRSASVSHGTRTKALQDIGLSPRRGNRCGFVIFQ
jgi:hypothetical protein